MSFLGTNRVKAILGYDWHEVEFMDGTTIVVSDPNKITEAVIGVAIYNEDGSNTLYPWHLIKRINRSTKENDNVE